MEKVSNKLEYNSLFFAVVLFICFVVSVGMRYQQFETWKKAPATFFVGERPMMTTLDAPYWLRWAREYNEGTFTEKNRLRDYPENTETFNAKFDNTLSYPFKSKGPKLSLHNSHSKSETRLISYRDVPLLSYLIAKIAPFFNYNYYLAGTLLIPILASLFILPLGIYFFKIGAPFSGLLGGLIGTFAGAYYMRSSIGRIDTDMLNLFFPTLASLLILFASHSKSERKVLLYAVGAGLSLFLFFLWYDRPGFTLAYFFVLVISFFIQKIRFRTCLLGAFLFVLCAHPGTFLSGKDSLEGFLKNYFVIGETASIKTVSKGGSPAKFPNVYKTISEADKVNFGQVLQRILSNQFIVWVGFLAFVVFSLLRLRLLIPLAPILALGWLSFQSSNRFIMFMAPFIGVGLGWILQIGFESIYVLVANKLNYKEDTQVIKESNKWGFPYLKFREIGLFSWFRQGIFYFGVGIFFWGISSHTAISFVPGPSIHTAIYSTFLEVKKRVPKNSALLTWWDYGYAITDATELATFHDGSTQIRPKTYFIARSLVSSDSSELYKIVQYLATEGNQGIEMNNSSPEALLEVVSNPKYKPWDPVYLFFTADMTGKFGAISKLGNWNINKGGSIPKIYRNLACNNISSEEINCRGAKINLNDGYINGQLTLSRLIFIRNGEVLKEKKFGHNQGLILQLIVAGKNIVEVQLIDEQVFNSNYNQMFLLGKYKEDLFEEVYNAFPFSRLYKIKY